MNMQVASTTPAPVAQAVELAANQFRFDFAFRTLSADKLAKLLEGYEESQHDAIKAQFDTVEDAEGEGAAATKKLIGYKRKTVSAVLSAPDWLAALDTLAKSVVQDYIAAFVKRQYIENFEDIGQHDWEYISAEAAKVVARGGSSKMDISDDTWTGATKSFTDYITNALNRKDVGERMGGAFGGKFSPASCKKYLQEYTPAILSKVKTRLEEWAKWVVENDQDNMESFAQVFEYLDSRLDKGIAATKVNLMDIL